MEEFRKTVIAALQSIVLTTVVSIIYGFIAHRRFTFEYVFIANIIVGTVVLCVALLMFMLPAGLIYNRLTGKLTGFKWDKLTDHTTYMERRYVEKHQEKQRKAYEFLFLGLSIMIITGMLELVMWTLIPSVD